MLHETLLDELEASAFRCKKSVMWSSKYAKMRFRPLPKLRSLLVTAVDAIGTDVATCLSQ